MRKAPVSRPFTRAKSKILHSSWPWHRGCDGPQQDLRIPSESVVMSQTRPRWFSLPGFVSCRQSSRRDLTWLVRQGDELGGDLEVSE